MANFRLADKRVWVAGHRGMVGSAVVRALAGRDVEILTVDRAEVDLRRQREVEDWVGRKRPQAVILAAAKVGGISANATYPADFIYDNLAIETNIIHAAHIGNVEKLLFLGSTCAYPKFAEQPIREDALLTGALEPTNEWYAVAKIAGLKLAEAHRVQHGHDFISAMPTNLYGPNDNFDLANGHVLPALMRRIHKAKMAGASAVTIWGTGQPRREFLHVDDLADAAVFLMNNYSHRQHVNVGTGTDISILELAEAIAEVVGYRGRFDLDKSKPDGTPRKVTDISRLRTLGWQPKVKLREGLQQTYTWFLNNLGALRVR
ncbi:GDP-L-fucose synthase family protein (plasmid) [Microvirga sp. RSM25]|uniref:GDP-L-fucose synthase n=1 Tax=Microvirga sp. RSM25 TaxID=3273802 RepID=UPI00384BDECD